MQENLDELMFEYQLGVSEPNAILLFSYNSFH